LISTEPTDFEYGARQYEADFAGHCWLFSETLRDTATEQ
jgi:hypothetical protein